MFVITFSEAVQLKKYIWEHFKVNLHIHDTCGGGLYFSIEEPNTDVTNFVVAYFKARGIDAEVSKDGKSILLGEADSRKEVPVTIVYESNKQRTAAYDGSKLIGECTYAIRDGSWIIEHTYVEDAYRNQKIAEKLVLLLLEQAKKENISVKAECSFSKKYI